MNFDDYLKWIGIANGTCTLLGYLPKAIGKIKHFIINSGFEIKTSEGEMDRLKGYLDNNKKSKEEKKRCKAILKKHNLPKNVGIMCKSEKDVCFTPQKKIVDKTLNNLNLRSDDGRAKLAIGGGSFAFNIEIIESGFVHQRVMYGTVIKHKGEIYLLRHPLGGYPNYLAKVDLFINGMIIEFDDSFRVGLYY
ncbi:MAG: hypothetical protein Ta2B_16120 [Termitinemataceae bacterium]|nr:MAG: hypothetical protein Ta2B_16120 [Termitinemataceae bacterium]